MPTFNASFLPVESALAERFGRPETGAGGHGEPLADVVTVLLERALESRKAARAVAALVEAGLLEPSVLAQAEPIEIVETLRASGLSIPTRVVGPLLRLGRWFVERYEGSPGALCDEDAVSTSALREELAAINGIGPATADAILLVALKRGVYPVDRATYRILARHDWLDPSADYEEARSVMERPRPDDPDSLERLSHWFERVGREFCRASVARCEHCPLRPFLPEGGARMSDGS